jgi:hypothetical protein
MQLPAQLRYTYLLQTLQTSQRAHPALHGAHSRWKIGQDVTLAPHLHHVLKLRTQGATPPTATRLHIQVHNFALLNINFWIRDPLLWSFEGADSCLPARDAASLVSGSRRCEETCSFHLQQPRGPNKKVNNEDTAIFRNVGIYLPKDTAVTSWQKRTLRNVAVWNANLALLDMVHTDTTRISWEPRHKNSANHMWVVQPPNIDKYYIHFLRTEEHWRNKQLGYSKENKAAVTSTPLSSIRNVCFRSKRVQMSGTMCTCQIQRTPLQYICMNAVCLFEVFPRGSNRCPEKSGFLEFLHTVE